MKAISFLSVFVSIFISAQQNVVIQTGTPTEPTIAISPINPNIVVAASNIDNYYYSTNGGLNWTKKTLSSTYGVWGDPVMVFDKTGNLFFVHLSNPPAPGNWIDRIVVQKSIDGGSTYNNGSFTGLNGTKAQDKAWLAADSNNNLYVTWTQFDVYGSFNPNDKSVIMFSKSIDGGVSWSNPLKINSVDGDCVDSDNTVEGAVPAIGPNDEIYVSWAGPAGLVFNRSLNGGNTWLTNDIKIDDIPGGWDFPIPGLDRSNGLPITACDVSNGANRGTIYVNWCDQRNGTNNTDVFLSKSTDGGNTWSSPVKVNNDNSGKHQFLTWMTIDQDNGNLYFVFYDRRSYNDNRTDVYLAKSTDGGETFINMKINDTTFTPNAGIFFGDYTNIAVKNGIIHPIWGDQLNGNSRIITATINDNQILQTAETAINNDISFYPNPVVNEVFISYKLHDQSSVEINIYDISGKKIEQILNENQGYGKYIQKIDIEHLKLPKGNYLCELKINNEVKKSMKFIK
ncbi:T9SS type A sorting domain-containing protein [Fluviicola sp.]|uniref:T9SS type A sorting domain-containing protein n=1 Tax=Fluviicola sp. TaxID=1917219 RepID=UPI0028242F9D|nr:T9SS type A sorting domain-containing protein [Fluviicola sp.]MDR0802112.1 T9SS type A sorting domain-containing protein [Fluviicola sp.]